MNSEDAVAWVTEAFLRGDYALDGRSAGRPPAGTGMDGS
jgi:hypothetical protein